MSYLLLVEDGGLARDVLCEALPEGEAGLLEADSPETALALLRQNAGCSTLITEAELGARISGVEVAEQARAVQPDLNVIYVTGRPPEALGMGPQDRAIPWPFLPDELIAAIEELRGA